MLDYSVAATVDATGQMDGFAPLAMTVVIVARFHLFSAVIASQRRSNPWEPQMKEPAVYIMANKRNGTLYTGVTSNLIQSVWQHREADVPGFTMRYGCKMLVWYEAHETMPHAITREKQIKGGSRRQKIALIEAMNPEWKDLYNDLG